MIFDCYHWRLELKERQVEKSVSQIGFTETNATIKTTVLRKARIFNSNDQWLYRAASHCHYKRKKIAVLLTVLPRPNLKKSSQVQHLHLRTRKGIVLRLNSNQATVSNFAPFFTATRRTNQQLQKQPDQCLMLWSTRRPVNSSTRQLFHHHD